MLAKIISVCGDTTIRHWISYMVEFYSLYILRAK